MNLTLYADGGSRGNPGPSATGFVIYKEGKLDFEGGQYLGQTTNNQAEWQAVYQGLLKITEDYPAKDAEVAIKLDSQLVVNQIKGIYKVKKAELKPWYNKVIKLLNEFKIYSVDHIYRKDNKEADAMVNQILDSL